MNSRAISAIAPVLAIENLRLGAGVYRLTVADLEAFENGIGCRSTEEERAALELAIRSEMKRLSQ